MIDLPLEPLPAPLCAADAARRRRADRRAACRRAGVPARTLGERVEAGDAIADLIDPVSGKVSTLRPTVPGVFFARTAHRHLLRGMAVGKIAGAKAFRAGKLLEPRDCALPRLPGAC